MITFLYDSFWVENPDMMAENWVLKHDYGKKVEFLIEAQDTIICFH